LRGVIPLEMNVKSDTPKRVFYPSLEDTRNALRERGRAMMPPWPVPKRLPKPDPEKM
jgi:hypothetical protein